MEKKYELSEVLEVASEAGHILLENGAEISRVEDIMSRIANHYGVDSGNFFVISNGIFTTGNSEKVSKAGGQASTYANVDFIPIRGGQLSKVRAVNQLSYDIVGGRNLSKIVGGISNALLATLLCIVSWRIGFAESLSNVIIAAMMPLVPGVPFVNGVRDLPNYSSSAACLPWSPVRASSGPPII